MSGNMVEISIQCAGVCVSYKGEGRFLESTALGIIRGIIEACAGHDTASPVLSATHPGKAAVDLLSMAPSTLTTKAIATRLKAKTGTELAMAAIAYLAIFAGRNEFTRHEILSEMKSATGFYKANMSFNLSKMLSKLIKDGKLNETGKREYSSPESEKARLENELAECKRS